MFLTTSANERSTLVVTPTFVDSDGVEITPTSLTWSLLDSSGNVINSRSDVVVASLSGDIDIYLFGPDLIILPGEISTHTERHLVLKATWLENGSIEYPIVQEFIFFVKRINGAA